MEARKDRPEFEPETETTDPILTHLLATLPGGWQLEKVYLGPIWTAAFIENAAGERRIGLAALPGGYPTGSHFLQPGFTSFSQSDRPAAELFSRHALSRETIKASAGLATLNALLQPDLSALSDIDAGDWLVEEGRGRKLALVGRFPFIDELTPVVEKLWVFEMQPQPGEYSFAQAPKIISQADILAVTASSLLNHSLHKYLALASPAAKVIVIGPTTPLSPLLFEFGVHVLSGVVVEDETTLLESIASGSSFRGMRGKGTRRVSLIRPDGQPQIKPKN